MMGSTIPVRKGFWAVADVTPSNALTRASKRDFDVTHDYSKR
jgi:hypothetical protein